MKKILLLSLVILLSAATFGCGRSDLPAAGDADDGKINIVSTIFASYDFARQIAGDKANVSMLLPPASESHSFEPTPQDIIKIQNCDVFVYVGGESESWVDGILASMDTGGMKILALTDCISMVEEEIVEGMQEEEEEDGIAYDEHVWTSPKNAQEIVRRLRDILCETDSANVGFYRQSADGYLNELEGLDASFQLVVDEAARKTVIFGDRFPFRYLADTYGLTYFAAFPGCAGDSEPSAATVAFLIDKVKSENIPVVFHIELSTERMADAVCEATGAKKLLLHACHNISKSDFESGVSYLDLMTQNLGNLKEALA